MNAQYYDQLSNAKISLEPLTEEHITQLTEVSEDAEIWRFFSADLSNPKDMTAWMTERLRESAEGSKMSYAVRINDTNQIIGTTSFARIDWIQKVIEIGWTWIGADFIGTGINKHMKFLMLRHAFEAMEIQRLELRTDEDNMRSRRAMEKIGAQHDGTLRSDRYKPDGSRRNSVVYSILENEWPGIRERIFGNF